MKPAATERSPNATRILFSEDRHTAFAALSGDLNPMHMDAVAARRTEAGERVVHGVHAMLRALDALAAGEASTWSTARVEFKNFIRVGTEAELRLTKSTADSDRYALEAGALRRVTLKLSRDAKPRAASEPQPARDPLPAATEPQRLTLADAGSAGGQLDLTEECSSAAAAMFPALAAAVGAETVAALALVSTVVGMHCPGLHSILSAVTVRRTAPGDAKTVAFAVASVDERFRRVVLELHGPGFNATVETFLRHPPVPVRARPSIVTTVGEHEFRGVSALVVGGSRGLGAACVQLLAAGGADITLTYARGEDDARSLADSIAADHPGIIDVVQLDVNAPLEPQLAKLTPGVTDLYYFATPRIFRQKAPRFDPALLDEFMAVYVHRFAALLDFLQERTDATSLQRVLFPSTVAIDERPAGLTEYVMAKAAGEILCADRARSDKLRILTPRLPRTLTDQTAVVAPVENADPIDVMLPQLRALHARPEPASKKPAASTQAPAVADKLRVMSFGGCTVNNPLLDLRRRGATAPIFSQLGFKRTAYALSPGGATQLLQFCRGELEIPSFVRQGVYADPVHIPASEQTAVLDRLDATLIEFSTPFEIRYEGFVLNQNRLRELIDYGVGDDKALKKLARRWASSIQKLNEDLRSETAAQLLEVLPDGTDEEQAVRRLVEEARGFPVDEADFAASLRSLQAALDCPLGLVLHNFHYMPDGRPVVWPPDFNQKLRTTAEGLGLRVFDPEELVAAHGTEKALAEDLRHWKPDFYPTVADAILRFIHEVMGRKG